MAQSGYSAYYYPRPTYPTPPLVQSSQGYDPRTQPLYHSSYSQQQHHSPVPLQRPPSRINPVPWSPGQPNGPLSAPIPQQQYGQYFPPSSPQPSSSFAAIPYPSPVSPQTPQTGTPQSARRPLPDPRSIPSSYNGPRSGPSRQTPSPGLHVTTHRPTQSVPNAFPQQPGVMRAPSGSETSPTSGAFSPTSNSPPRPLPLPRSLGSLDSQSHPLPHSMGNLNSASPQSPSKRALPKPNPLPGSQVTGSDPPPAPGQKFEKFVPLWKRALPQPGGSLVVNTPPSSQVQASIERRSTVSGVTRPLPSPGVTNITVNVPKEQGTRTGTLAPNLQSQYAPASQRPPSQPLNTPAQMPPIAIASADTSPIGVPRPSRLNVRERSRTLPLASAVPTYPPPPQPTSPTSVGGQIAESPVSSDDEELTNALLERHPRTNSPQYGIRDLPRNNHLPQNDDGETEETTPRARRNLPISGPSSNHSTQEDTSLTMRMASVSLQSTSPSSTFRPSHGHSQSMSGNGGSRPMPQPPAQSQSQRQNGWPASLPPLPRAPATPSSVSSSTTQSAFAEMHTRALPQPTRPNSTAAMPFFARPRSPRRPDLDMSLDDAPPPSLRRSPVPPSSFPQRSGRSPVHGSSPLPSTSQMSARSSVSSASGPLQRAPSDAASVFSLSKFPAPPSNVPASPQKGASRPSSPTKPAFRPCSPTKPASRPPSPTKPAFRLPSPAKPQSSVRSPSPMQFQLPPQHQSAKDQSHGTPRIPKISFPASADGDSDEEDTSGPIINISGPGEYRRDTAPSLPRISFGGDDDGLPSISIGGPDDGPSIPQISLPGEPSVSFSAPKKQAQTQRMQEILSNPRLEAAKRSGLVCGGCGGAIIGRIVSAMDMRWHPGCFRCCVCAELLENLSSFAHDGRPYCHLDYHEQFAPRCYHCETAIVDERFITLDDSELGKRTYHEQHFFCAECGDPFLPPASPGAPSRTFAGDGAFVASAEDDVGFTVYKGHPYCEACHVRLRMPKCKKCKKSIRDGMQAVEALGGKWCWECFTCASCDNPFENPAFFQRDGKPFCERCFSIMIRNEI